MFYLNTIGLLFWKIDLDSEIIMEVKFLLQFYYTKRQTTISTSHVFSGRGVLIAE
jgi:hypothetical protein